MFSAVHVGSDEWMVERLVGLLAADYRRMSVLQKHFDGTVSVPDGGASVQTRAAYSRFLNLGRLNFAQLIVRAVTDRWQVAGFVAGDLGLRADAEASKLWRESHGPNVWNAVSEDFAVFGRGFVVAGAGAEMKRVSPWRAFVDAPEGEPWKAQAGVVASYLPERGVDQVTLFRVVDGAVWVRSAEKKVSVSTLPSPGALSWSPGSGWSWAGDAERVDWAGGVLPLRLFEAPGGRGQFEPHLDALDRINHQIFQRLTLTVMQAFRQRAVKGLPLLYPAGHPKAGQEIDYEGMFQAGPAALWQLPPDVDIWESAVTDIRPLTEAVSDDVKKLAAASSTPLYLLSSDAQTGSAEGASVAREALVFKVEKLQAVADSPLSVLLQLLFASLGRGGAEATQVAWVPADRSSVAERAAAASQAASVLPKRTVWRQVFQFTPAEMAQAEADWEAEQLGAGDGE